jgi:hypothetical protein
MRIFGDVLIISTNEFQIVLDIFSGRIISAERARNSNICVSYAWEEHSNNYKNRHRNETCFVSCVKPNLRKPVQMVSLQLNGEKRIFKIAPFQIMQRIREIIGKFSSIVVSKGSNWV